MAGVAVALVSSSALSAGAISPAPATPNEATLTVSSNGSTLLASKGELVVVKLSKERIRWSEAQAIPAGGALKLVSESTATTGASKAVFRVVGYGSVQLTATGTPKCGTSGGCPQFVVLWQATVNVPVVDPPAPASR